MEFAEQKNRQSNAQPTHHGLDPRNRALILQMFVVSRAGLEPATL